MRNFKDRMKKTIEIISSVNFFAFVSSLFAFFLVYETLVYKGDPGKFYFIYAFLGILIVLNIFLCSASRFFGKIKSKPHFKLIHWGIIIVILGFIFSGIFSFQGEMFLVKGEESNLVQSADGIYKLPFRIKLEGFYIEYYKDPKPYIYFKDETNGKVSAEKGVKLKKGDISCEVENFYSDFSIKGDGKFFSKTLYYNNPAVLLSCYSGKNKSRFWLFEKKSGHISENLPFELKIEDADIKDFKSEISIFYKGDSVKADVSVNNPFSFEGYKIYQTSYEPSQGEASILTVKKDKWFWLVMLGFISLSLGVLLWII